MCECDLWYFLLGMLCSFAIVFCTVFACCLFDFPPKK